MIYAVGFYWLCAGLASFAINDAEPGIHFTIRLILSLLVGGVMVPVRVLTKLAA